MKNIINILVFGLFLVLAIWFFPKKISTCSGTTVCYGYVQTDIEESTWLNVKESKFELRVEKVKSCIGRERESFAIFDGCPGDWGWFNARPVNCDFITQYCTKFSESVYGVNCSEWQRACNEIKSSNSTPINIDNINETGVNIDFP